MKKELIDYLTPKDPNKCSIKPSLSALHRAEGFGVTSPRVAPWFIGG